MNIYRKMALGQNLLKTLRFLSRQQQKRSICAFMGSLWGFAFTIIVLNEMPFSTRTILTDKQWK